MKKLVFSTVLVLSIGLVGCSEKATNEKTQKETVFEILGGKGAFVAEAEVLEIYSYNNPSSDADITLSFIEGKFKSTGELKGSI